MTQPASREPRDTCAADESSCFDDDCPKHGEPWDCVDCGIPLEPGTPPICEECVES